ncbi:hypothetical protein FNX48_009220 [Streptomyces sp. IF17]|nr:hypothetical protein [Streptomyces alkaliphilus]
MNPSGRPVGGGAAGTATRRGSRWVRGPARGGGLGLAAPRHRRRGAADRGPTSGPARAADHPPAVVTGVPSEGPCPRATSGRRPNDTVP